MWEPAPAATPGWSIPINQQWFVKVEPLAKPAIRRCGRGTQFIPERFAKTYFNWMENIKDWCISRQLWWGHRIPVWYCDACGKTIVRRCAGYLSGLRQRQPQAG